MRNIDKDKNSFQKAIQAISFEKVVLERLEELASKENTKLSTFVNNICKQAVMNNKEYYTEVMKYHLRQFHVFKGLRDNLAELEFMEESCRISEKVPENGQKKGFISQPERGVRPSCELSPGKTINDSQ